MPSNNSLKRKSATSNKKRTRQPSSSRIPSSDITQSSSSDKATTMVYYNNSNRGAEQQSSANSGSSHISNVPATSYLAASMSGGMAVKRIRTPHPHDVLSGRGGGINGHKGNVQFREWVRVRKNDYNLARDKHEKALVAQEVIALVQQQDPPGRFLQKDPSSIGPVGWWIELDEEKVLAKTAQALREGAPQIRAEHRDELQEKRRPEQPSSTSHSYSRPKSKARTQGETHTHTATGSSSTNQKATSTSLVSSNVVPIPQKHPRVDAIVEQLRANAERALVADVSPAPPSKRVRVDYNGHAVHPNDDTPPLLPSNHPPMSELPPLTEHDPHFLPPTLPSRPSRGGYDGDGDGLKRAHSLALSDISLGEWAGAQDEDTEFVNPFEGDELHRLECIRNSISSNSNNNSSSANRMRPGVTRDSSTSSHGDLGGLSALMSSNSSNTNGANSHNYYNHDASLPSSRSPLLLSPRWTNHSLQQQQSPHSLSHSDSNRSSSSNSGGMNNSGSTSGVRFQSSLGNLSSRYDENRESGYYHEHREEDNKEDPLLQLLESNLAASSRQWWDHGLDVPLSSF